MNFSLLSTVEALLLVIAISTDAFVASIAYGTNKIKIPALSVTIIDLICTSILALSLLLGSVIRPLLPAKLLSHLCFALLLGLGFVKLSDSTIKAYIRRNNGIHKKLAFSIFKLRFILNVYANPEEADTDASHSLSPVEALSLSVALSLDGLAVGFGAALATVNVLEIILLSLLINGAAVILGCHIGNKIAEKLNLDLSWLSGLLLIILAFIKL